MGGGSNILANDKGFEGLAVKTQNSDIKSKNSEICAGAGAKLNDLVKLSVKKSLTGLEWAAGIPGTLGGAIYGNAGWPSNKKNISAAIKSVDVLEASQNFEVKKFSAEKCGFGYRDSAFKHNKNLIILAACLKLEKGDRKKIEEEISETLKARKNKIPVGFSAGCVFKNPPGFFAGELIEKCGLKGKKIGGAKISEKHANFIINSGKAKSEDVIKLINLIKGEVKNKLGVALEEETQYF